jgi:hypothetical protein
MFDKKSNVIRFGFSEKEPIEFKPFYDLEGAEVSYGFVDYQTKEYDSKQAVIPFFTNSSGRQVHAVKFRVDKRTVPGKLLKKETDKALAKLIEQKSEVDSDTGEVIPYIPSKGTVKELKSAIKNKLLKQALPVPSYYDVFFISTFDNEGYGYISTNSEKVFEYLKNNLEEYYDMRLLYHGSKDEILAETDIHSFISTIWEDSEKVESVVSVADSVKLGDGYDGKVSVVDYPYRDAVDSLLDNGCAFVEAEMCLQEGEILFKLKNNFSISGYEDECMLVDEEEIAFEVEQRISCLDGLFTVLDNEVKKFLN